MSKLVLPTNTKLSLPRCSECAGVPPCFLFGAVHLNTDCFCFLSADISTKMIRCINCTLCLDRMRRHSVSSLPENLRDILVQRLTIQLPEDSTICHACFNILNEDTDGSIRYGHAMVCIGCGCSLARTRSHAIEENTALMAIFRLWNAEQQGLHKNNILACHTCWRRAERHLQNAPLLDPQPTEVNLPDIPEAPVLPPAYHNKPIVNGDDGNFPPCHECKKSVDARELYRCVQCPLVVMCADCGRSNAHALHCVLRMPSLQIYNEVEYLFELLTDMFHKKLSQKNVNDEDVDNDYDVEKIKQELEFSVHEEDHHEDQNQTAESAIPGSSKKRKSSASTFLSSWRDEASAPEPPDENIKTSYIKTEPDTDPLACPPIFNILHTPTDEPKPKKRRTMKKRASIKDNFIEIKAHVIEGNRPSEEEENEEEVEVKLEPTESDATLLVDTERYASYGSHRAGNTDL